jgi:DNA-binding MarR family transcriptional regulator
MGTRPLEVKQSSARAARRAQPTHRAPGKGILPSLIGYQLRLAQKAIFEDFAESVTGTGISPGLFGVLVIIEANPGLTQQALADAMHLDRSTMVNTLDKLGERDLVERRAADKRSNGLYLTDTGIRTLRGLKRRVARHEQRVVENLSLPERAELIALLQRILPERR